MATDSSTLNNASTEPQWYWLSNEPQGLYLDDVTEQGAAIFNNHPSPGWQPYEKRINEWLERALSYMKKTHKISGHYALRMGLFLPMINGNLDYSWSDMSIDFCNGVVRVDRNNYVNINEMKPYSRYDAKKCKQVKREPPITNPADYYFHSQEDIIGQMLASAEVKTDIIELQFKMKETSREFSKKSPIEDKQQQE